MYTCNIVYDVNKDLPTKLLENQEVDKNSGKLLNKDTKEPIVTKSNKKTKTHLPDEDPMQKLTGATSLGDATVKHEVKKAKRMLAQREMKHFGKHIKGHKKRVRKVTKLPLDDE